MKKVLIFILLPILFFSCKKLDKLTQFDLDYTTKVTVPSSLVINTPFDVPTPEVETNSSSTFSNNNTRSDLVESIVLSDMKLELTSPTTSDLSFLNEVIIYIKADGLEEKQIAIKTDIPNDVGQVLKMNVSGVELKDYLLKDKISLRVKVKTDKIISQDHDIDVKTVFRVDAKVFGI